MEENKLIFKPKMARDLLKRGHQIVDIKADKENSDRTIFVFKNSEKLKSDLKELSKN